MGSEKHTIAETVNLFVQGKTLEAIQICFGIIKNEPTLAWPHLLLNDNLVFDRIKNLDLDEVICFYRKISKHSTVAPDAHIVLGNAFTKQGNLTDAISAFKTGMSQKNYSGKYNPSDYHGYPKASTVDFMIIGIGRGGTSSLYRYLSEHPKILCPAQKELHFFNNRFELGLDWYLAQFPPLPVGHSFQTGEATPWYLVSHGVADRVHKTFPKIKLVILLRNPIDRAISQYHMHKRIGLENRSPAIAMASEIAHLSQESISDDMLNQYWQTERGYLLFGLYIHFIQKWTALFPPEQLLVLKSEDLYRNTHKTLEQVYDFLGLPQHSLCSYSQYNSGSYPKVSNELHQKLADFFSPYNQRLENYLDRAFDW